jgi:hypothetical protein
MPSRGRAVTLVVLCSVSVLFSACSRHTARTARLPSLDLTTRQKPAEQADPADQPADVALQRGRANADTRPNVKRSAAALSSSSGAAAKAGAARAEAGGKHVGGLELWSVEVRQAAETPSAAATGPQRPQPNSPLHTSRQDGSRVWLGLLGMLVIAAVAIGALALRRSGTAT